MDNVSEPVRFDTKIAVLLRDDLASWQRLNVTAFLVSGIAGTHPEVVGEAYEDADGQTYLPMFRQPVLVFEGSKEFMATAHERALKRGIEHSVFTQEAAPFSIQASDIRNSAETSAPQKSTFPKLR